ncbi:MAG TPA: class I adenylate-forming enzyme family protein, partial [Stellaceae bacterium]|nr:class I adenylate-forming enzyme family protein [Stellaceae bacterium]
MSGAWKGLVLRDERHYGDRVFPCHAGRPENLAALIATTVDRHGDDEAIVAGGRRLTFREVDRLAGNVAGNLAARGIKAGDRIALLLCNCPEFVIYAMAAIRLGAIAVPLGARLKAPELDYALNDCAAAALVYESEYAGNLPDPALLPNLRLRILIDGATSGAEPCSAFLNSAVPPSHQADEEDTAFILYTSGTTGQPKGALLTHLGIIHSATNFVACLGLGTSSRGGERAILTVPAAHVTGLVALLFTMLRCGGCTIMMREFKARDFLALAAAERLTYTLMVPAQYALCLMQQDLAAHDLSSWRIGAFGGAPMPEATIAALARTWPDLVLVNGYGATETTSPTALMPLGLNTAHPDSVGQIVPGGAVRIVDDTGAAVPPGAAGEIWIKGAMVVPGYWNRPDADRAEFSDGFWHSGDIGSLDAAGFLRVLDRKKDMINRAGYKIYSAEVENVLLHHPGIVEAAIIGSPDPVLGERVKAFIRRRDDR